MTTSAGSLGRGLRTTLTQALALSPPATPLGIAEVSTAPNEQQPKRKVARNLETGIVAAVTETKKSAQDKGGRRHEQALVIADPSDSQLTDLHGPIVKMGGAVDGHDVSINALSVLLPGNQVHAIHGVTPQLKPASHWTVP